MNLLHIYDQNCFDCVMRRRADWISFRIEVQLSRGKSVEQFGKALTELASLAVVDHEHVQP